MFKSLGLRPSNNGFRLEPHKTLEDPIIEGYNMLAELEMQSLDIIHDHLYSTYTGTRESSTEIVLEGLGDMISGAVRFFKELIKRLIEFFKKAAMYMTSLFLNFDKFIERYKDKLTHVKEDYSVYGYEYDFSHKIPNTDAMMSIVSEFNSEVVEASKLKKEDLVKRRDAFLESGKMDVTRGIIIGKSGPVEADEFRQTVFSMFRQGKDTEHEIRVDNAKLRQAIDGYPKLKKQFEESKKDRYKLERLYTSLENFFAKGPKNEYSGNTKKVRTQTIDVDGRKMTPSSDFHNYANTASNLDTINYYYSFKWKQAQEIGTYTLQSYIEKINALKEAVKLNEKIIRGAIFARTAEKGV